MTFMWPHSEPQIPCVLRETEKLKVINPLHDVAIGLINEGFTKPLKIRGWVQRQLRHATL